MPVAVQFMPQRQERQSAPEIDPMDRILKGLNIAANIYGLKTQYDQNKISSALAEASAKKEALAQEKETTGVLTKKEFLEAGKNYDIVKPETGNSIKMKLQKGPNEYEDIWLAPKAKVKEIDPLTAAIKQQTYQAGQVKADEQRLGKPLPAGEARSFGEANASFQALDSAQKLFENNAELSGPIQGRISGAMALGEFGELGQAAKVFDAALKKNAQTIGKYLEGGKLTDSDIERYKDMLPNLRDSAKVAAQKTDMLKNMLAEKQALEKEALGQAGFNVQGIRTSVPTQQQNQDEPVTPEKAALELIKRQGLRSAVGKR